MLKFIRGRGKDRSKHLKDLFSIQKTSLHGFPHHPTALAYDPQLGLIAIASKRSSLRIYGKPGVEFSAELDADLEVRQIKFIPGSRGQLILLAEDGTIQLWELNGSKLDRKRSSDYFAKEKSAGTLKAPTTFEICLKSSTILVGTQSGNIHTLQLDTLELLEQVIYQDVVLQNVPAEHKKSSQGSVEVIAQHPTSDNVLIGYQRGLIALWNNLSLSAENFYSATQQLESLSWLPSGDAFVSSHNDGSIINWKVSDNLTPSEQPRIPYGPFPCKPMNKVACRYLKNNEQLLVFSGGMPRASYGDKFTVTICEGEFEAGKHHVLDFSSKVIDFVIIDEPLTEGSEIGEPKAVVILLEEELVAIDLLSPEWLQFKLPYLSSVHSSGITSSTHYSDVPDKIFKSILEVGQKQNACKYSSNKWPIIGGAVGEGESAVKTNDLLITGHEDGSISIWNASDIAHGHILSVQTRKFFMATDSDIAPIDGDEDSQEAVEDPSNEWPPFRKAGIFDPYSDDVRLAIRNIVFCPSTGQFVAAGTAGQVVTFKLSSETVEKTIPVVTSNIVDDSTGFVWKGHAQLHLKNGSLKFDPGLIPESVFQVTPPAAVTALALNSDWNLLSAGTAHGFAVVDLVTSKVLLTKSTLSAADVAATSEGNVLITRRKSFKKSLRESFRRLREGRGSLRKKSGSPPPAPTSTPAKSGDSGDGAGPSSPTKDASASSKVTSPVRSLARGPVTFDDDSLRLERQIEAKTDDGLGSMVRILYMAQANVTSANVVGPSLWVGTNAGTVYIFTITLPEKEKRSEEEVVVQLAKEIQLKHRAPVIYIQVIDSTGAPVSGASLPSLETVSEDAPPPAPVEGDSPAAPSQVTPPAKPVAKVPAVNYRVLIVSEEQFKLFQLPSLKPERKSKLTAHEGSRARKIIISSFLGKSDEKHLEYCLSCLSNQGDVSIYDLTDLKRQAINNLIKKEDAHGIASPLFTAASEGFFLHSPSEFQGFSLSSRRVLLPTGIVEIPDGVRPVIVEPVVIPEVVVAATSDKDTKNTEKPLEKVAEEVESAPVIEPESVATAVAEAALAPIVDDVIPSVAVEIAESVLLPASSPSPVDQSHPEPDVAENNFESLVHQELVGLAESEFPSLIPQQDISSDGIVPTNGHHNGMNGDNSVNGDNGVNVDNGMHGDNGDGLEEVMNGTNGASSSLNDTDVSYATNDITIDSVRDFTNLTLCESPSATTDKVPKKIVTPTPPSALDTANSTTVGD